MACARLQVTLEAAEEFIEYDRQVVARRLDVGLGFLIESAQVIHSAFKVPAPQLEELASRLDRERSALRAGDQGDVREEAPAWPAPPAGGTD